LQPFKLQTELIFILQV